MISAIPKPICEILLRISFRSPVKLSVEGFAGLTFMSSMTSGVIPNNTTDIVRFRSAQYGISSSILSCM